MMFVNQGMTSSSFNVYQSYLIQIPDVGDIGGSLILTIRALVSLAVLFVVALYYRVMDLRWGIVVATLCTFGAFVVYSQAICLAAFCVGAVLAGVGYGLGGMAAASALIGNWFPDRMGAISGIASMGTGVSSIIVPLAVGMLVSTYGLQSAFTVEAAFALVAALLLLAWVRSTPKEAGLEGFEEGMLPTQPDSCGKKLTRPSIDLPKPLFRLMLVAVFLLGAMTLSPFGYFSVLVATSGHSIMFAALATSLLGIVETCSKSMVGWFFDRLGSRIAATAFMTVLILGLLACAAQGLGWSSGIGAAIVLYGVGIALPTTAVSIWSLEYSTPEKQMETIRAFQIAYAFGGFAFNMMPGMTMATTGSYAPAYGIFAVFALAAGAIAFWVNGRFHTIEREAAKAKARAEQSL